jgi:hypothetical protein
MAVNCVLGPRVTLILRPRGSGHLLQEIGIRPPNDGKEQKKSNLSCTAGNLFVVYTLVIAHCGFSPPVRWMYCSPAQPHRFLFDLLPKIDC